MSSCAGRPWATRMGALALLLLSGCERDMIDGGSRPQSAAGAAAPRVRAAGGSYSVERGDTLYSIARRHNLQPRDLIAANGLQAPYALQVGQRLVLPGAAAPRTHMVESGESVAGLAQRYRVDQSSLAAANQLQPPYTLRPGQRLTIPASGGGVGETRVVERVPVPSGMQVATAPATSVQAAPLEAAPFPNAPANTPASPAPASVPFSTAPSSPASAASPFQTPPSAPLTPTSPASSAPAPATVAAAPLPASSQPASPPATPAPVKPAKPAAVADTPAEEPASPPAVAAAPSPPAAAQPAAAAQPVAVSKPPARAGRTFLWPVRGKVISTFGPQGRGLHNDGITIAASRGTVVKAPENGVVEYVGSEIRGYGNLLLIRHADGWMSAYAHMDVISVGRGDVVRRGQGIGKVGTSGSVSEPQLHFQLRKGSEPVDPEKQLGS